MAKIRTLIVDDEPLARERIRTLLEGENDIEVLGECTDGREAVTTIEAERPDLVFLDVQMPELDGFGVLEVLDVEEMPVVVFVTAFDQFALRAFDAHAVDYLLKPFDRERFQRALGRARIQVERHSEDDFGERLRTLLGQLKPKAEFLERLAVRAGGRIVFIRTDEVDWIDAQGNYARLHLKERTYLLRETMSALEAKLDPARFVRIHRSTIVNAERIRELEPMFAGEYLVILRDGTKLPSSRTYRDKLHQALNLAS